MGYSGGLGEAPKERVAWKPDWCYLDQNRKQKITVLLLWLPYIPSLFPSSSPPPPRVFLHTWLGMKSPIHHYSVGGVIPRLGKATTNHRGCSNYRVTDTRWWSLRRLPLKSTITAASAQMEGYGGTVSSIDIQYPITGAVICPALGCWVEKEKTEKDKPETLCKGTVTATYF